MILNKNNKIIHWQTTNQKLNKRISCILKSNRYRRNEGDRSNSND